MSTHTIITSIISLLSLCSIVLAYYKPVDLRRYACLFGLAAQPFWIAHVWISQAWGILPLTPAYTLLYLLAVRDHWYRAATKSAT